MKMYGVASIVLDKVSSRKIGNYIKMLTVFYFVVLFVSVMLPQRLVQTHLGNADYVDEPDGTEAPFLRFRNTFKLTDPRINEYEIVIDRFTGEELKHDLAQEMVHAVSFY